MSRAPSPVRKVLVVEDDAQLRQALGAALPAGVQAVTAGTLREARQALERLEFHLILLDLNLPDGDGMSLCGWIRAQERHAASPIVLITARQAIEDKLNAFSLGGDDYLVKPFDLREFRARVEAKLKKAAPAVETPQVYRKGNLKFLLSAQRIVLTGDGAGPRQIEATPLEFRLLLLLARDDDRVFSRTELLESVWSDQVNVLDRTVDSHVSDLRKKLRHASHTIHSVRGVGYQLVEAAAAGGKRRAAA